MAIKKIKLKDHVTWPPPFSPDVYTEYKFAFNKIAAYAEGLKGIMAEAQDALKRMSKCVQDLPESFKILANHGWFISFDFELWQPSMLAKYIASGNFDEVDRFMIKEISNSLDEIEHNLIARFPNRTQALKAAFKAHRSGDYFLSVPVFLAQTEGMTIELTGYSPFSKENRKPKVGKYLEQESNKGITYYLLSPLSEESLINKSKILDSNSENFNRHEILHGKCTNYGTEINSYKSISLAYYIGEILYTDVDELYKLE